MLAAQTINSIRHVASSNNDCAAVTLIPISHTCFIQFIIQDFLQQVVNISNYTMIRLLITRITTIRHLPRRRDINIIIIRHIKCIFFDSKTITVDARRCSRTFNLIYLH